MASDTDIRKGVDLDAIPVERVHGSRLA